MPEWLRNSSAGFALKALSSDAALDRCINAPSDRSTIMIGSLSRSVELLTVDIEHEETRAGVRDLSDPAYPVLARSLRTRRDNIGATSAMPENLFSGAKSQRIRYDGTRVA